MKALIIEDDFLIALDTRAALENLGHIVCGVARNAPEAIDLSRKERPDLIIADFMLDGPCTGVDAVRVITAERPTKVIYVTGNSDRVREADPDALVLEKPFDQIMLAVMIRRALASPKNPRQGR